MIDVGKLLVIADLMLGLAGGSVWGLGRTGFRMLPGVARYETEHVRVYFPLVTCLVLSVGLSVAKWLSQWFNRK